MQPRQKHMGLTHWKNTDEPDLAHQPAIQQRPLSSGKLLSVRLDPLPFIPPQSCGGVRNCVFAVHGGAVPGNASGGNGNVLGTGARSGDADWTPGTATVLHTKPLRDLGTQRNMRYSVNERCRIKEFGNYTAETMFKDFKLPLIFRKPVAEGHAYTGKSVSREDDKVCSNVSERNRTCLPQINQSGSFLSRPVWREALDTGKSGPVSSIPSVDRHAHERVNKLIPRFEAKGTKLSARSKGNKSENSNEIRECNEKYTDTHHP